MQYTPFSVLERLTKQFAVSEFFDDCIFSCFKLL